MAQALKSALPSHLKPSSLSPNDNGAEFARKHHGKTQSHMVCVTFYIWKMPEFNLLPHGTSTKAGNLHLSRWQK